MPHFGATSSARLSTCDERIRVLFRVVVQDFDCTIIYGARARDQQAAAFREGRSKVQWPDSRHNIVTPEEAAQLGIDPRPESLAVDAGPWPLDWDTRVLKPLRGPRPAEVSPDAMVGQLDEKALKNLCRFYHFAGFVLATAARLGTPIRWGGDWDGDGDFMDQTFDDLVHFELLV